MEIDRTKHLTIIGKRIYTAKKDNIDVTVHVKIIQNDGFSEYGQFGALAHVNTGEVLAMVSGKMDFSAYSWANDLEEAVNAALERI